MNVLRLMPAFALVLALWSTAAAQTPTPVAVIPTPGTQVNPPDSCLIMSATAQAPGFGSAFFPGVLTLFSLSSTFAYTCDNLNHLGIPGNITYSGLMEGGPNMPFILAISIVPGSRACGNGTPCMTTGSLFSNTMTPYGRYHLDANPIFLLDGINPGASNPATLNSFGRYFLNGLLNVTTVANGGTESRMAVQALTASPSSMSGFRLSACLNVDQWVTQ